MLLIPTIFEETVMYLGYILHHSGSQISLFNISLFDIELFREIFPEVQ